MKNALLLVFLADLDSHGWYLGKLVSNDEHGLVAFISNRLALQLKAIGYECTHLGPGLYQILWSTPC